MMISDRPYVKLCVYVGVWLVVIVPLVISGQQVPNDYLAGLLVTNAATSIIWCQNNAELFSRHRSIYEYE
jgi:hypothetical protein